MMSSKGFIGEIGHLSLPIPSNLSTSILRIARMCQRVPKPLCQHVPKPLRQRVPKPLQKMWKTRKKLDRGAIHRNNTLETQTIRKILVSILHSGAMFWTKHKNCGDLGWHRSAASRKETSRSLWRWPCSAFAKHFWNIIRTGTKSRMVGIHHSSLDL